MCKKNRFNWEEFKNEKNYIKCLSIEEFYKFVVACKDKDLHFVSTECVDEFEVGDLVFIREGKLCLTTSDFVEKHMKNPIIITPADMEL